MSDNVTVLVLTKEELSVLETFIRGAPVSGSVQNIMKGLDPIRSILEKIEQAKQGQSSSV